MYFVLPRFFRAFRLAFPAFRSPWLVLSPCCFSGAAPHAFSEVLPAALYAFPVRLPSPREWCPLFSAGPARSYLCWVIARLFPSMDGPASFLFSHGLIGPPSCSAGGFCSFRLLCFACPSPFFAVLRALAVDAVASPCAGCLPSPFVPRPRLLSFCVSRAAAFFLSSDSLAPSPHCFARYSASAVVLSVFRTRGALRALPSAAFC